MKIITVEERFLLNTIKPQSKFDAHEASGRLKFVDAAHILTILFIMGRYKMGC